MLMLNPKFRIVFKHFITNFNPFQALYEFIFTCLVQYLQTLDLYANFKWGPGGLELYNASAVQAREGIENDKTF